MEERLKGCLSKSGICRGRRQGHSTDPGEVGAHQGSFPVCRGD